MRKATPKLRVVPKAEEQPGKVLFNKVYDELKKYIVTEDKYLVAMTLWAFHTYVYDKSSVSPRLAVLGSTPGCGKTNVLRIMRSIAAMRNGVEPKFIIDPRSATIFRWADSGYTLLVDEVDNLQADNAMKSVLNAGYTFDGKVPRIIKGEVVEFHAFAPLAVAGIVLDFKKLPPQFWERCIIVKMVKVKGLSLPRLNPQDFKQQMGFMQLRQEIERWAEKVQLRQDPTSAGRHDDNWRVFLAIADSLGVEDIAQKAMTQIVGEFELATPGVYLIRHSKIIFDEQNINCVHSQDLCGWLRALETESGHDWKEYGLTPSKMSRMFRSFGVKSHTVWYPENAPRLPARVEDRKKYVKYSEGKRGYTREDLKEVWALHEGPG